MKNLTQKRAAPSEKLKSDMPAGWREQRRHIALSRHPVPDGELGALAHLPVVVGAEVDVLVDARKGAVEEEIVIVARRVLHHLGDVEAEPVAHLLVIDGQDIDVRIAVVHPFHARGVPVEGGLEVDPGGFRGLPGFFGVGDIGGEVTAIDRLPCVVHVELGLDDLRARGECGVIEADKGGVDLIVGVIDADVECGEGVVGGGGLPVGGDDVGVLAAVVAVGAVLVGDLIGSCCVCRRT